MVPVRSEDDYVILKCVKCGYEVKSDKKSSNDYRIKFQVDAGKRIQTAKATEARVITLTPEERELLQEYYEIFLESFEEEESSED